MSDTRKCHWCRVSIRRVEVFVGADPGRPVDMWLDVDPHPDGEVVQERPHTGGRFRRLLPDQLERTSKPTFRIHGKRTCGTGNRDS